MNKNRKPSQRMIAIFNDVVTLNRGIAATAEKFKVSESTVRRSLDKVSEALAGSSGQVETGFNTELMEGFNQVCVWPGVVLGCGTAKDFVIFFREKGFRIQYLEEVVTAPDRDENGEEVPGTGGRVDQFFSIHDEDIVKFAVPRLRMGIRWIEDAMSRTNGYHLNPIWPERVRKYCRWDADSGTDAEETI